jgi:hypothetical protein
MANGRQRVLGTFVGLITVAACGSTHPGAATGGPSGGRNDSAEAGNTASNDGGGRGGAATAGSANSPMGTGGFTLLGAGADMQRGDDAGASSCELGEVSSAGTNQNLDLFGSIVYFADGIELPAGRYRITYVDGCMKYSAVQAWSLHAYAGAEPDGWWFVGKDQTQKIVVPPGTVGFLVGSGGFSTFEECVTANLALPPSEFEFSGGKIGAWLQDAPYTDNLAGEGNRNPKWKLTLLGDCDQVDWPK